MKKIIKFSLLEALYQTVGSKENIGKYIIRSLLVFVIGTTLAFIAMWSCWGFAEAMHELAVNFIFVVSFFIASFVVIYFSEVWSSFRNQRVLSPHDAKLRPRKYRKKDTGQLGVQVVNYDSDPVSCYAILNKAVLHLPGHEMDITHHLTESNKLLIWDGDDGSGEVTIEPGNHAVLDIVSDIGNRLIFKSLKHRYQCPHGKYEIWLEIHSQINGEKNNPISCHSKIQVQAFPGRFVFNIIVKDLRFDPSRNLERGLEKDSKPLH